MPHGGRRTSVALRVHVQLRQRKCARLVGDAHARASGRPGMFIGRSRVSRHGARERLCIDAKAQPECAAARRLIRCLLARLAVCASSRSMAPANGLEQEPWPAHLRMRDESGSASRQTAVKHAQVARTAMVHWAGWVEGHLRAAGHDLQRMPSCLLAP